MGTLSLQAKRGIVLRPALAGVLTLAACLALPAQEKHPASSTDSAEAHVGKGYELIQNNRFEEAAGEFQAALALDPNLAPARYQLAVCYFGLHQLQKARQEFVRLEHEAGHDSGVVYYLGRLDLLEEKADAAISRLEIVAADPPFPDTAYYLGSAYLKKEKLDVAEKWLKKAAELDPRDFRVPDHLARVYMKAGRRAEAERQFALSASLREHYNEASKQSIACVQALDSQPLTEARSSCQKLFDPNDPDKLVTLGMIYGNHADYADSLAPFEGAARLDPESFEIQHNLGLSYFRLKRYSEARQPLEKAVALRPDFFGSNALLGATLYALKEDEGAYSALNHAYELNPQDADTVELLFRVSVLLAEKRLARQEYSECRRYLEKASRLRPNDPEVQRRLAEVNKLPGR